MHHVKIDFDVSVKGLDNYPMLMFKQRIIWYIPAEERENVTTYQREDERDMNIYEDIELVGELDNLNNLQIATATLS